MQDSTQGANDAVVAIRIKRLWARKWGGNESGLADQPGNGVFGRADNPV
jgi:hypothetical protein